MYDVIFWMPKLLYFAAIPQVVDETVSLLIMKFVWRGVRLRLHFAAL